MNWLDEKSAAEVVKRHPRVLRRNVKAGKWQVKFRTLDGRSYSYLEKDVQNLFINKKATSVTADAA